MFPEQLDKLGTLIGIRHCMIFEELVMSDEAIDHVITALEEGSRKGVELIDLITDRFANQINIS